MNHDSSDQSRFAGGICLDENGRLSPRQYERLQAESVVDRDRFGLEDSKYSHQYFELYNLRLRDLRPRVLAAAREKWGQNGVNFAPRMADLRSGELSFVVGTIYINTKLKSRALDEVKEDEWPLHDAPLRRMARDTDQVVLEDESGRIVLINEKGSCEYLVTGMVVGVLGVETPTGTFIIREICMAEPIMPASTPKPSLNPSKPHKYIAFISGIKVTSLGPPENLYTLVDFLNGSSGCGMIQKFASQIVRLIIAGNTFSEKRNTSRELRSMSLHSRKYNTCKDRLLEMEFVDNLLCSLGKTIDVDVLPGVFDPVATLFPRQPLNSCILPLSSKLPTVNLLSDPALVSVDGVEILGTSGCNVDDIYRYSHIDSRINMAHLTLLCSHIAPTAPDTLWCYPFSVKDSLVLESWPNIYFVGNQPAYEHKLVQKNGRKTLILLLPSFSETAEVVLVDLETLEPSVMEFPKYAPGDI